MRNAQNESVRSMRLHWNSRGGGGTRFVMSGQARNIRQMPEVLRMVESVPHQKRPWRIESDEFRLQHEVFGHMFVQQGAHLKTPRTPFPQQLDQTIQRLSGVDDVLDQQ